MNTGLFAFRPPGHAFATIRPKVLPARFEPSEDDIRSYAYHLSQQAGADFKSARDHWMTSRELLQSVPDDGRTVSPRRTRRLPVRSEVHFNHILEPGFPSPGSAAAFLRDDPWLAGAIAAQA